MTSTSQNRFNMPRLAVCFCVAIAVSAPALAANAASSAPAPVSVTVEMPKLETPQDRDTAIANFRAQAFKACKVNGTRGLSARQYQKLCADDLVDVFTQKIDHSIMTTARLKRDKKSSAT